MRRPASPRPGRDDGIAPVCCGPFRHVPNSFAAIPAFAWFKAVIFALLAVNTAVFAFSGTPSEGLDSAAWLVLLVLFELETGPVAAGRGRAAVIHGARLVAALAILVAAVGYFIDQEWLDAINSTLWIAVVAVLEFQVRFHAAAARYRALTTLVAAALYSGLAVVGLIWLWQAEWFAAFDAALWLLAFVAIEMNVLELLRRRTSPHPVPQPPGSRISA